MKKTFWMNVWLKLEFYELRFNLISAAGIKTRSCKWEQVHRSETLFFGINCRCLTVSKLFMARFSRSNLWCKIRLWYVVGRVKAARLLTPVTSHPGSPDRPLGQRKLSCSCLLFAIWIHRVSIFLKYSCWWSSWRPTNRLCSGSRVWSRRWTARRPGLPW